MSSKISNFNKTKKKTSAKSTVPKHKMPKPKSNLKITDEGSDDSSIVDELEFELSDDETYNTDDTSSTKISQEFSDEDELMKYYESKIRSNGSSGQESDESGEKSDLPPRLQGMINGFRKTNFRSQPNKNVISSKLVLKEESNESSACASKSEVENHNHGKKRGNFKVDKKNTSITFNESTKVSTLDHRKSLKEEAAFQKSEHNNSYSQYSMNAEDDRRRPEGSGRVREMDIVADSLRKKSIKQSVLSHSRFDPRRAVKDKKYERRNKIIEYLGQIDEAEMALHQKGLKVTEDEKAEPRDAIAKKNQLLQKYGFELTSNDELLKLGGAAEKKKRRQERRKMLFPTSSSSSSSSGSGAPINAEIVEETLRTFLGKDRAEDIDVREILRHGKKWRNCLEDGHCQCRPKNEEEKKIDEEINAKRSNQFFDIFDGKQPKDMEYSREDLLKAHEKIGPWIHNQTKKLDKFIKSGKYSPEYLLHIWDGRLLDDSSGDEPNYKKYREEYEKKLRDAEQTGVPIPPEDRVPTLEENNWFLFPTPITRMYGKEEMPGLGTFNSRGAMEAVASDLKRIQEVERAKEYLEKRNFPEPHLYPRPIDLTKMDEPGQIPHPLLVTREKSRGSMEK